ncbi:Peptidoglycan/LPS O-acetylase OafA/YrhL, contains acyltransferase and SGNH-hydrolase domains [Methylobacterium phyllostachyos]|uniref:Peptidoglycan/LPS O-acetylase OafA/YrhL, contains acyltransferase and SGNH-hydrolase domains n=1 Tax=Methylobacterium phyllostachyos TaxID=582672 RepID=A0A1H0GH51_9HYPH|nr:acyltransferase [Methylobacterium phyllostachyos]SDO06178.1 Peptidoglycan/LPS O-acetylase OafA/YrhL, contains acyltransferase and SGNH-hydrolase domains [Methylobacterium phyllostachyos]
MILVPIQILRGLAALMVVWHHARHEADLLAQRSGGPALDPGMLLPWWGGVDLFFVISGLVIVLASGRLYGVPGGRARFLAHRIARVVPLYWLVSLAYLALALARPDLLGEAAALVHDPTALVAGFLFWPAARPDGVVQPLYGLGWTLNYEAFFYALFTAGLGFGRRGAAASLIAVLGLLVAAGAVWPDLPVPLRFWANPIVLEFAAGAGLALAYRGGTRLAAPLRAGLAVFGLLGLILAAYLLADLGEADGILRPLLVGVPAALLVASALGPGRDAAQVARLPVPTRALVILGDASYALYLVHPFALRLMREVLLRLGAAPALHPYGGMILMLAASITAALLVHRYVETPLTRRVRRLLDPIPAQNRVPCGADPVPHGRRPD